GEEGRLDGWTVGGVGVVRTSPLLKGNEGSIEPPYQPSKPSNRLRCEARQRLAAVALTQPLQGSITQLAYPLAGDTEHSADLLRRRLSLVLLQERLRCPDDLREIGRAVQRHPDRPAVARERGQNGLPNPPHGV